MGDRGIATYYDRLTTWNQVARVVGYGGGRASLTVHRALADPRAGGRPTSTRLHDVLLEHLPAVHAVRALDAGCGLGGTLIALAGQCGGHHVGLTLSPVQAEVARRGIAGAGLSDRVQVQVGNYDQPPPGPFDWVLAIESLAHSPDPRASVSALASVLAPQGVLAIVDDMPERAASPSADLAAFKAGWGCPVLWSRSDYVSVARDLGLQIRVDRDLTPECRPRSSRRVGQLRWLNRLARRVVPLPGFRGVMTSHDGGLALEQLTREGLVHYRLLIMGPKA